MLSRIPDYVSDGIIRGKITVIRAGLTDGQTATLQTAVNLANTTLAAVRTAISASSL